jgi:hypothetical protein
MRNDSLIRLPGRLPLLTAIAGAAALLAGCGGGGDGDGSPPAASPAVQLLSSKAEYVTGDDALVEIRRPTAAIVASDAALSARLNGADVSAQFTRDAQQTDRYVGLVRGLRQGANSLEVGFGGPTTTVAMTNHPASGPMLSGPQITPHICQTQDFNLPDGSKLGPSTDASCAAPTKVNYLYRSTAGGALRPLPATAALPADVATTTTTAGVTVPFVVRVETGTMNRGIYQNAILHNPATDGAPTPTAPPRGWNRRLIGVHGSGCTSGWYVQGAALGVSTYTGDNLTRLGEGYAVFNNTLNHPANSCNALLAGETALMGKEHFIETFGVPYYTVSTGGSGGAYTSLQTTDTFPGLFDGVFINSTYPDALAISMSGLDDRLLSNYYLNGNPGGFSEPQMVAVTGHRSARAWYDLALQSGRTDPVPGRVDSLPPSPLPVVGGARYASAVWPAAVPTILRYSPATNPAGARPTVFDIARNVYGIDRATGFALRPFDNVGVQYGLKALNAGTITPAQFLDLNERIGGYDQDANYVPNRSTGSTDAIRRAYQAGLNLNASGGLSSVPILDISTIFDENDFYHYQVFHFAVRERLAQSNGGDTRNHVMWRGGASILTALGVGGTPVDLALNQKSSTDGWNTFIQWVEAYKGDTTAASQREKVIARKPAAAVDGCFSKSTTPAFIAETQTLGSQPDSQCNALWPSYTLPRIEAGGPVSSDRLKCVLKPVDARDYAVAFSGAELARLNAVFPGGVCDYQKPGVNQTGTVTYPSFGPSPVNLVFDIGRQ